MRYEYKNPETEELDWFEPKDACMIVISTRIIRNNNYLTPVRFKFGCDWSEENVTLHAEYYDNGVTITSKPVQIYGKEFSDSIANALYTNTSLEETDLVVKARQQTSDQLLDKLKQYKIVVKRSKFDDTTSPQEKNEIERFISLDKNKISRI